MDSIILTGCEGFEWDEGNHDKNHIKHDVRHWECEQVFFNRPLLLQEDEKHSQHEKRHYVLGKTDENRKLFIAFAIRNRLIRIISARDMSRKERRIYEQTEENSEI